MESSELTEDQFKIIKALCANRVLLITIPHLHESMSDKERESIGKTLESLKALQVNGLLENHNDEFKDATDQAVAMGYPERDFYTITDLAYKMFNPDEGTVN